LLTLRIRADCYRKSGRLAVRVKSPVSRIVLEGRKAVGVRVRLGGGAETQIRAKKGVVLAAGALVTPKILMLSGIGPGAHLKDKGMPVLIDLPGVGKNMHDHLEVYVTAQIKQPISMLGENKGCAGFATASVAPPLQKVVLVQPHSRFARASMMAPACGRCVLEERAALSPRQVPRRRRCPSSACRHLLPV